jgi:hypothetical protein
MEEQHEGTEPRELEQRQQDEDRRDEQERPKDLDASKEQSAEITGGKFHGI